MTKVATRGRGRAPKTPAVNMKKKSTSLRQENNKMIPDTVNDVAQERVEDPRASLQNLASAPTIVSGNNWI